MIQIAIDGPASSGKSSLSKALSQALNILYLDTGAMYRAVTLAFLDSDPDLSSPEEVKEALAKIQLDLKREAGVQTVYLNGENVTEAIRQDAINEKVSEVAAIKEVRDFLVQQQRELAEGQSIVMDGRDIGTVVLPEADLKIFLTASPEVRAQRRFAENEEKGLSQLTYEELLESIKERDALDSQRKESPLVKAADAIEIDNGQMTTEETLTYIMDILSERDKV